MKRTALVLLALAFCPVLRLSAANEIFGYFENRFYLVDNKDVSWSSFNQKFQIGDYNRLRLSGKFSPGEKVVLNVAVDMFSFHGILQSPLGTYDSSQSAGGQAQTVKFDLDRAYVDLYLKKVDLAIGKQRVAIGVSYLFAPLDIFNRVNLFEPKEEKPGTTAFKAYMPIAGKSSVTAVFAPESDFGASRSALRGQAQLGKVDVGLTLMRWGARDETIWGLDLRGENFIGWWLEGGIFSSPAGRDYKAVAGFDYTFPIHTGLYWQGEFFYDSSGEKDPAKYNLQLLLSGERFTLGRAYFYTSLRYAFSNFVSGSAAYIGNWIDGSFLINPMLQYDLTQSVSLYSGFYFPGGGGGSGEFSRRRQNIFFLWLKVNF